MPIYYVSKVSSSRHYLALAIWVALVREVADMPYSSYVAFKTLCLFFAHSLKCAKYMRKGVHYNGNFSFKDFNHLTIKR
jgi:hypothetical protein